MYSPRREARRHAVSFKEFSRLIENLPGIAEDVQRDFAGDGANKTLDECARWYYNAFYKDLSVRNRYKFKVRACAKLKKDKLLSLPEAEVDETSEESQHESADDVEVKVDKMGMFMFPVTFGTFAKYADKDKICKLTTRKEKSTEEIESDSTQKRRQLQKFYNSFYMFPEERKCTNIFPEAPPDLLLKLLQSGYPVDEETASRLAEHKKKGQSVQELETHREPDTPEAPEASSDFPIVSFQVFEKYLANLHDIVWQLKLNDPEYVAKGFDEGAYCYYLAFYLTPEIRDRYKYILRPCTSDLSARLLAIPSREEAEKLRRKLPELIKPSPDLERPKSPDLVTETAVSPVEFKFFKKYIVNLDDISQQMRGCDEYKDLSEGECVAEYFRQFYSAPEIRERFQYKLKPCPGMVRERLLGRPVCSDGPSNGAEQNRPAPMKDSSRQSDPEPLPEDEDCVENDNNNKNKCPVTFKEFKRSVSNLSEIVQKMQQSEEYREKSEEQCAEEYYRGFYSMPEMRERFECKFKPCPAKQCELLLRYAVEPLQPPEEQSENIPPQNTMWVSSPIMQDFSLNKHYLCCSFRKPDSLSSTPDDVVTIGTARFKFPVSLGVFRRCINYDEIVRSRLGKSTVKPQLQAQTANPQNPHYERYFRQFYVGFYAFPYFRKQHAYRFDCGGDKELLQKLCDYAVPLNESAKRKVDDEEKLRRPTGSRGRTEAAPTLMPKPALTEPCGVTPKISFEVFSKLLYLEDAVSKMLLHPNFAALTEDECQRLYYEAFYSTPSIRDKYPCRIKPCPASLRANLLHIPPKPDNLSDHRHPQRNLSGQRQSTPDVDRLYADRKAELDGKQKLNVVNYVPHNLSSYIARRVACPERRAVVEKYIVETVRDLNEAAAISVSGLDTARREIGEEEKTEATPVAATIDVETTAATGREPAECPAASIEVEGEVEKPEESRVKGDTVPESTTDSVPASNANNQCSTTLPEVEKTTNAGTTTSVTASNEVQTPASEVTEHTIKHLIFQSNGLKSTIWRILFQLSQEEFRTYTSFHNGEALYENEGVLQRCHQHMPSNGAEQNRPAPMKDSSRQSDPEPLPEDEDCVENDNNNKNKCPVTFKEFKRSVSNLSEIVQKMQQSEEYREKSEEQCAEEYYRGFYSMPEMRERFECKFKPCPAKKCELLLRYAVEPLQPPEEQSENIPPQNTMWVSSPIMQDFSLNKHYLCCSFRKPDSLSSTPDDVVTIGTARFKFPVSLGVFRRCINYDEIVRSRLGKSTVKPQLQAQTANPQNPHYERYFRQFYVGFYAFPYFRKQHAYRFDCGGDKELLQKLCDYAVPLNESAKRKVDDEEKLRRPTGSRGRTEAAPTLMPKPALTEPCGVTPKISFEVFSKLLYLEDAVSKMLLHPNFAALTEDECQRLYYEAFYSTPSIRDKYPCRIKPCPAGLRANLLHIPPKPDNLSDHRHPQRNLSGQRQSTPDVDRLYADRKAELDGKQKLNVVNYVPHNLSSYIARRVACPERRAVVEKYIVETVRDLNEAAAISVSGLDTARREIGEEEKTEATPVAATIDVETTAATGREPAECPAASIEVEGEVEKPEESRVKGDTVPESTTDSVPASNANNQCSTTLPEVEKTTNAGTTTSVTASNEVQTPASEVTEHTIKHLIFQSNGLKSTIWRILFQLSQEEFRTYTSFHNGEALYENEGVLQRCHQHVVGQGHWPFNLYVKLPMLRQLLHSKGVELQSLDLFQLSPKILHWSDLMLHTDFDEIVEQHYADRTGRQIDDAVLLFQEREHLYASCWTHDQWIRQVPKITNEALNEPIFGDESAVADVELKRLCGMEESQATAMTIESDNTTPTPSEVSICLPTELNAQSFNFVDMDEVDPASQIPETQNNPLMESMQVPVKQEAIKFLDNLRGSYINSQEFLWESIDSKEQIINLDGSQESISGMACFAIRRATELASSSANAFPQFPESENHSNISTEPEIIETRPALIQAEEAAKPEPKSEPDPDPEPKPLPAPASIAMAQLNVMENEVLVPPLNERLKQKHKMPDPNVVATKKPRLNEKVPQLRHEFRALPLHAVVRIESSDFVRGLEDEQPTTSLPVASEKETTITASQDFASGNTLLASSQLDVLLNAPNVTVRKVNDNAVTVAGSAKICDKGPPPEVQSCVIFRDMERYRYFRELTTEQIIKHRIDGYIVGSTYQDALIKINSKLCNVRGPLIETLFPHMSARLRSDLRYMLCDLGIYIFNCRWLAYKDSTQDLRARVLSMFMDVAPQFVHFRAEFDNATREWATCSTIDRCDPEPVGRRPKSDVGAVLKPGVLGRMIELKAQLR
ncbi:GL16134 [Drosophila persimilis]|uniref:GL16134 n=1 Tax=Drosophila persimilis TaxID=7234 RepID=B4H5F6_DROPE|nr:GL16134 [Drosophila persimilis]